MKLTKKAQILFLIGGSILGGFQTGCDKSKDQLGKTQIELNQAQAKLNEITGQWEQTKVQLEQSVLKTSSLENQLATTQENLTKLQTQFAEIQAKMIAQPAIDPQNGKVVTNPSDSNANQVTASKTPTLTEKRKPRMAKSSVSSTDQADAPEPEVTVNEPSPEQLKQEAIELARKDPEAARARQAAMEADLQAETQKLIALKARINSQAITANNPEEKEKLGELTNEQTKIMGAVGRAANAVTSFKEGVEIGGRQPIAGVDE